MNELFAYFLGVSQKHHGDDPGDEDVDVDIDDSHSTANRKQAGRHADHAVPAKAERGGTTMAAPAPRIVAPPKPSRMTLSSLVRGRLTQPTRVVLFGVEGIGKSTFGANAPKPVFLGAEDGTAQLDVARFPKPENFSEVMETLRTLTTEQHEFETLVVDTLDWLEPLVWDEAVRLAGDKDIKTIEDFGFGRGYTAAIDIWRRFLRGIEDMRKAKPMHVVLIAHSWSKAFKNPEGLDYDRYEMKLNQKAAGLLKEWGDCVLFAKYETYARVDEKTKRVRGVDTGARIIYTERRAAYDAKNRYSLPPELPLSWGDFWAAVQAGQVASPEVLRAEILRKAADLGPELLKVITETVEKAGANPQALAQINNRVNARLAEQTENNQPQADQKESVAS